MNLASATVACLWHVSVATALVTQCAALAFAQNADAPSIKGSATYQRAFALITQRRGEQALQAVKELDEKDPQQQAERLAIEAWVEFVQCRFESAEERARGALMLSAEQPLALMLTARLLASEGSLRQAAVTAAAAARADPNNPVILWRAQEVLGAARKEHDTRLELLDRVIALGGSPELQRPLDTARDTLALVKKINDRPVDVCGDVSARRAEFTLTTDTQTRTPEMESALPNGTKNRFRVDTGAFLLILSPKTAAAYEKESLTAANPAARAGERMLLSKFPLGDLHWESVLAAEVRTARDVLPMTLFRNSIVVLDLKNQKFIAFAEREAFEKEWTERLKRSQPLRYRIFGNAMFVACNLFSDGGKETRGAVLLSTGVWESQFSLRFGEQWRREQNVTIEVPQSGAPNTSPFPQLVNPSLRAGGITFTIPRLPLMNQDAQQQAMGIDFAGVVGMNFLHNCEFLVFDGQRRVVFFGPPVPKK